jgi:Zn-finger nucleic acid-binding protein
MFQGSRFCGFCGAIAAPVDVQLEVIYSNCPRCRDRLEVLDVAGTKFRSCPGCDGLWMDIATFENVCAERERQSAVLGYLGARSGRRLAPTKVKYVPCPDCGQLMNRNNFAKSSGVIVDICKQHGIWFDSDELSSIVDFINKGGMEIARQRERAELDDKMAQIRDADRERARLDQSFGGRSTWTNEEADAGVRGFIQKLFE